MPDQEKNPEDLQAAERLAETLKSQTEQLAQVLKKTQSPSGAITMLERLTIVIPAAIAFLLLFWAFFEMVSLRSENAWLLEYVRQDCANVRPVDDPECVLFRGSFDSEGSR